MVASKLKTLPEENPGARLAIDVGAPFAVEAPRQALDKAGTLANAATTPVRDGASPILGGSVRGAVTPRASELGGNVVGDTLNKASDALAPLSAIGGVLAVFGSKAVGIRGKSEKEQRAIFGQATLSSVQTVTAYVPIAGPILSALEGVAAKTYEGKRVVAAAGRATQQSYQLQKNLLNKGQLGLGSTQHDRKSSFFALVDARVAELKAGGKLTEKDVQGLSQAKAYGYTLSGGFDLSKLDLKPGTNPFAKG